MIIEKNKVVELDYKLHEGSLAGNLIEETFGAKPLTFIFGIGQMIPAFEENLEEKKAGDAFAFLVKAAEGYGEYDSNALISIPIEQFAVEGQIDRDALQADHPIKMQDMEGKSYQGIIKKVGIDQVDIDFNHPMAGVDLYFSGIVLGVREATDSELDHGHIHE